jgi:signal transduction histidine kinase
MNRLAELYELYIFERIPNEQRTPGKAGWWRNLPRSKHVPYSFTRGMLLTIDTAILAGAVVIGSTSHAPIITIVGLELLYIGICVLLLLARAFKQFLPVVGIYLAVVGVGVILNLVFPDVWGNLALYMLCVTVFYRIPPEWSLPFAGICMLALITTNGALPLLPVRPPDHAWSLISILALACGLCWVGWSRRAQFLLVMKLHETQEMLKEQMARGEELAAERERTRIARDIHDVLSHSLAVLSIQVQAARNLRARDPERLAEKLDDMAALIRESMTESRRVVGLLREKPPTATHLDDLSASLRLIANTFNERTGIHCRIEERGTPHEVNPQQRETLELALREMLTNAHRHGAAQTAWITVQWREASIVLETRDDGVGANGAQLSALVRDGMSNGADGHHGLQGMRERATALGGDVEAGSLESGGFVVSLRLPFESSGEKAAWRGK